MKAAEKTQIPSRQRFLILQRDNFACAYCGARPGNDRLQVDHMVSRAIGGSDHDNNLVTACDRCNNGKGALVMIPRILCDGAVDSMGWITWRKCGDWNLKWYPNPIDEDDYFDPVALSIGGGISEYWIGISRVHESDWEDHLEAKEWMEEGTRITDFYDAIDFARTLITKD